MRTHCLIALLLASTAGLNAQPSSQAHTNRDLNTPREFPSISSRAQWQHRAREIREQVLVSCGLWPLPNKTPLHAHVFGKSEREGYSVEKVYLETMPGFYLGGNLYRPLGHGKGPFPGVLNPHGHWSNGRMADEKDGSIAGRCIGLARLGMVAFSYDMIGYNDTRFSDTPTSRSFSQVHHEIATNRTDLLWSISLMGMQTWNSIRALDFLESLPDVDRRRLACTGESGGGTQTFMLGAVEDRLAAQAPVVMVSHTMQGGCLCENAPGLRVEYSNMEIAARPAPRVQMLVAATGDWTKDTLTVEGPSIAHIYQLLGAPEKFHYVRFNYDHNYNQTSREAVYAWFNQWLLKSSGDCKEQPFTKEADSALRVFPGNLPENALTKEQFLQSLRQMHRDELAALQPKDKSGWKKFQQVLMPAWRHTLQIAWPEAAAQVQTEELKRVGNFDTAQVRITGAGEPSGLSVAYWAPPGILQERKPRLIVLASSEPATAVAQQTTPAGIVGQFLAHGFAVLVVAPSEASEAPDQFSNFYSTYNRTRLQRTVRDLIALCSAARSIDPRGSIPFRVTLAGSAHAGLWALLAAPAADAVVADCCQLDSRDEGALLAPDLFAPGLLAMGGFETAALLAAPHPLMLHNTEATFSTAELRAGYTAVDASSKLRIEATKLPDEDVLKWISKQ